MASIVGEQKSLPQLLSFTHFPVTSSVAVAIPEVQVANVIPVCVWKEWYKKILLKEKWREKEGETECALNAYIPVQAQYVTDCTVFMVIKASKSG